MNQSTSVIISLIFSLSLWYYHQNLDLERDKVSRHVKLIKKVNQESAGVCERAF